MSQQDLKHALISLILGVITLAITQLVTGALHIFTDWLSGLAGGTATAVSYLNLKHFV